MRDLLSKLHQILLEETTLRDLKLEPMAKDPVIAKAIKDKEREETDGDIEESGLQYYIGKKKYGKDGMKKLAQAGRDGASEEELGKIKDQYKKESFEIGDEFGISFTEDFEIAATIVDLAEDGVVIELDDHALSYLAQQGFTFEEGELVEEKQKGLDGKACWKGYKRMGTKMKGGRRVDNCVKIKEQAEELEEELTPTQNTHFTLMNKHRVAAQFAKGAEKDKHRMAALDHERALRNYDSQSHSSSMTTSKNRESMEFEAEYQGREVPLGKPMAGDVKKSKVYVKNPKGNVVKVNFGDKKMRIKKSNPARRKSFRARHKCHTAKDRTTARYWSCRSW